jgi:hypothetical protein
MQNLSYNNRSELVLIPALNYLITIIISIQYVIKYNLYKTSKTSSN